MENDNNLKRGHGPFFISYDDLKNSLLTPNIREGELVRNIKLISENFTNSRSEITKYVLDEKLVSSYTSFYFPTNIPKLHFLFEQLSTEVKNDLFNREFIDFGAGPGTFSFAFRSLRQLDGAKITCIDSSFLMLDQSKKLMTNFFPGQQIEYLKNYSNKNEESVLFFGNSINEIGVSRASEIIKSVSPEYVIWIEPGTSELFLDLKKLRSDLVSRYDIIYPCPSGHECPNIWCHQVLRTTFHPSIERISQLVGLNRKTLPLVAHVYRKKKNVSAIKVETALIVQYLNETKFSFLYEVCILEDGENKLVTFELLKKFMNKEIIKKFKNANVGEKIIFSVLKKIDNVWRVRVESE